ncbi:hypothetical protein J2X69_000624 [Algoriphagus sp. 4150]|uniref:DUF3253 domain-containing protein n=1 Tax=Algoriphagus sp. 4150 TaxID=2817756 RepID=UPI002855FF47|nr:DUF3253 domain-containing protein [Algoriphagus sp. 4150]MDR7128296.1 hypothetical protein [Algoriphagus sp. 4150]
MEVLRTAILDMLRRKKGESFPAAEVVEQMFPQDWEHFLEEVNKEAVNLYREGLISIKWNEHQTEAGAYKTDSLQILPPNKLK